MINRSNIFYETLRLALKKIHISNYKSLKNVELELNEKNVLVGPNMSGKSNLIDGLKFLTEMCSSGLSYAFLNRGGFPEVAWKGGDYEPISFKLIVCSDGKDYVYEISIGGSSTGLFSIKREYLEVKTSNGSYVLIDIKDGHGKVFHTDGSFAFAPPSPASSALEFSLPGWEGMILKEYISRWRFYRLLPSLMKQSNAAVAQSFLTETGNNFSSWFMTLQTSHPEEFKRIKQVAKDVFPELEEILTPPTQFATTYMITKEKNLKREISIWNMSDGEIVFLAWLSLIFSPPELGAPLYCIEEAENHLHPKLLEILVEVLNQRMIELGPQSAQIIVTTHSPYLVDKMELEDLIVFEKREGATQCLRPTSKKHLKELLEREEIGLGDLWYSGALGSD